MAGHNPILRGVGHAASMPDEWVVHWMVRTPEPLGSAWPILCVAHAAGRGASCLVASLVVVFFDYPAPARQPAASLRSSPPAGHLPTPKARPCSSLNSSILSRCRTN
jgi:hypothetical protein